jgi:hypothetical protein
MELTVAHAESCHACYNPIIAHGCIKMLAAHQYQVDRDDPAGLWGQAANVPLLKAEACNPLVPTIQTDTT